MFYSPIFFHHHSFMECVFFVVFLVSICKVLKLHSPHDWMSGFPSLQINDYVMSDNFVVINIVPVI